MSSTNSANPIACQAGLAVLDEIEKKNLVFKTKKGKFLLKKLNNIKKKISKIISYVSGHGLIYALIFKNNKNISKKLKRFSNRMYERWFVSCLYWKRIN